MESKVKDLKTKYNDFFGSFNQAEKGIYNSIISHFLSELAEIVVLKGPYSVELLENMKSYADELRRQESTNPGTVLDRYNQLISAGANPRIKA